MSTTTTTTTTTLSTQDLSLLREITSTPPSLVDATAACELAVTLNNSKCPHLERIGYALDLLYGDRLLTPWFQALEWECCLKDFLRDDLCLTFYGLEHFQLIRSDLRYFDYTKVYRHESITPNIIHKYKLFKYGTGACPYPTRALRHLF